MVTSYWKWAWVMLGFHVAFAVISWFWLPAQIPIEFTAAGVADMWVRKSPLFWYGMLLPSVFFFVMIYQVSMGASLATWNIPEKERFRNLTPEQQRPVMTLLSLLGAGTTAVLVGLFLALQVGMYLMAIGIGPGPLTPGGLPWFTMLIIIAPLMIIYIAMVTLFDAIREAVSAAESPV